MLESVLECRRLGEALKTNLMLSETVIGNSAPDQGVLAVWLHNEDRIVVPDGSLQVQQRDLANVLDGERRLVCLHSRFCTISVLGRSHVLHSKTPSCIVIAARRTHTSHRCTFQFASPRISRNIARDPSLVHSASS